jgi:tetratricopeptide (TPR) repeat protein
MSCQLTPYINILFNNKLLLRLIALALEYTPFVHIGTILLLGILSYANSLHVPLQFDDGTAVRMVNNTSRDMYTIQDFFHNSRWFVDKTFSLNRSLHGEEVLGYHLVNLAIHLSSSCLIYLFLQLAVKALKRTYEINENDKNFATLRQFIPFATAALFVCHPIQTQAVTYIAQRYTSLATFLYLGSIVSYLLSCLSTKRIQTLSWGCSCFLMALLAMKSKEIAFTLPFMIVALDITLFRGQHLINRLLLALGAGLLLVIPLQMMYIRGIGSSGNLLGQIQSAVAETQDISRTDYLLTQFRVLVTYLRLLLFPINQNLDYDYPVYHSLLEPPVFASLLFHIVLMGLALTLFIRSRRILTSDTPIAGITACLAGLGIIWFYLTLSVESSLVPIKDVIFEHRIYLPSIGIFITTVACIATFASYWQRSRNVLWAATIMICLVLTASTIARNRKWSSEIVMWQDVLEKSPNKARARHAVGLYYIRKLSPEKALPYLVRALELDSGNEKYWFSLNETIEIIEKHKKQNFDDMKYYSSDDFVKPEHSKQWSAMSYNNLGLAYEHLGNMYSARNNYIKATYADPSFEHAWYNLALLAAYQNDTQTVTSALERLRAINPQQEQVRQEISNIMRTNIR